MLVDTEEHYACSICDQSFEKISHVLEHIKIHSEEVPSCPFCGISDFEDLNLHLETCEMKESSKMSSDLETVAHYDIGPYYKLCFTCDKFFLHSFFKDHLRDAHNSLVEKKPKLIEFEDDATKMRGACGDCGETGMLLYVYLTFRISYTKY